MTPTPGSVVTYKEKLPSIKVHDTGSSDFDLSYSTCRFRMQTPESSPTS